MSNSSKSIEPWQLLLIIILVVVFFGGLYGLNQAINAKLEEHEAIMEGKLEMIDRNVERLELGLRKPANSVTAKSEALASQNPTAK